MAFRGCLPRVSIQRPRRVSMRRRLSTSRPPNATTGWASSERERSSSESESLVAVLESVMLVARGEAIV